MSEKCLIIIAGCNGSGKSTFTKTFAKNAFDGDKHFKTEYDKFPDSEFKEQFAINKVKLLFNKKMKYSLLNKKTFSYETNFNNNPERIIDKFKKQDFKIQVYYLCLFNTLQAKKRVLRRITQGGHFVNDTEIVERFKDGYKNLDKVFNKIDELLLIDASQDIKIDIDTKEINKDKLDTIAVFSNGELLFYDSEKTKQLFHLQELKSINKIIQSHEELLAKKNNELKK